MAADNGRDEVLYGLTSDMELYYAYQCKLEQTLEY